MDTDNEDYFYDDTEMDEEDEEYDDDSRYEVIGNSTEDEDDFNIGATGQAQTKPSKDEDEEEYVFEVLDAGEVVKHMSDCITEVNVVLQLPSTFTRVLLNHFKWDKDKLMELFYDGDEEKLFSDVKILTPFRSQITSANEPSTNYSKSKVKKSSKECEICFLPVKTKIMIGVQCGHSFCDSCWNRYLTTKIMDEGSVEIIRCAGHGCNSLVDDETVMKFVKDQNVKSKYQHLITKSFVECNRLLHWCMEPKCNYVIKVQHFDAKPVTCKCSNVFCFACGENWHDPIQCKWLKNWIKKCNDDSETSRWLAANTKDCPKCKEATEKNGGCNHMTCKKCRHEYCWVCMGDWKIHNDNFNCNRYVDKGYNDAKEKARVDLDRYLFYFNRYDNHMKSLKFEHRLYSKVELKMEEMQKNNMSWIEVQFLKKAVDVLCECRRTLMYTYPFAFYLKKNNQSIIFEDNQNDLEKATEQLSQYLERDLSEDMMVNIKIKVQDKLRYCEGRRKVLIDHVHVETDIGLIRNIDL